jgi:hypothetical protein
MPDAELVEAATTAALRLIAASPSGEVSGEDLAREVGRPSDDVDLYYALREAERSGVIQCQAWGGGMGLPAMIRRA